MPAQVEVRPDSSERKRQLVLVAEDERHDFEIYGKVLWYNGFDVIHAADGEEGLRLAREREPDLVVLDLILPKLDGIEVCKRIKESDTTRDIPVIMLSARAEREFGGPCRQAGAMRYLEKPIGPIEVLHIVEDVIGRPPPPVDTGPEQVAAFTD